MSNKQFKKIRNVLGIKSDTSRKYGFITTAHTYPGLLRYTFTYVSTGQRAIYKVAKKIYKELGVLPKEQKQCQVEK